MKQAGPLAGRYQLGERVGLGGMAVIYRARDQVLDRDVAVKVLHDHLADDAEIRERFHHEARHAAALSHPHIVQVFDQGEGPPPYIVMELVDGPSLREVLHERGCLSPAETLAVVLPVCEALARAHAAGVVHCDIKPENVLIDPGGAPKVADFGIAQATASTLRTAQSTLIGSVHYMAPELARGRAATPASDQYAVGVLVFELLTGRKPLPADTPMAVLARHAREPIPRPSRFARGIPRALDRVVARACARDPADRFPDLASLAAAMRAAVPSGADPVDVHGDRTLVIPAGESTTTVPPRPRRRSWRSTAALVAVLTLALLSGVSPGLTAQRTVPGVEGLGRDSAALRLRAQGLAIAEAPPQPSRDVPEGKVLSQQPLAGSRLRRGETVTVVLSSGPAVVAMPRVLELGEERAREVLAGHGFTVTEGESYSDDAPRGQVIAQLPDTGAPIREGAEVRIHLSLGPEPVPVPDVVGASRRDAEAALAEVGLVAAIVEEYSDEQPDEGRVVRQAIGGGTVVDKGSTVEVVISRGPLTVRLPNLRGDLADEARAALQAEGLAVTVVPQPLPRFGLLALARAGEIADHTPGPGRFVRRGDTVTLVVYAGE